MVMLFCLSAHSCRRPQILSRPPPIQSISSSLLQISPTFLVLVLLPIGQPNIPSSFDPAETAIRCRRRPRKFLGTPRASNAAFGKMERIGHVPSNDPPSLAVRLAASPRNCRAISCVRNICCECWAAPFAAPTSQSLPALAKSWTLEVNVPSTGYVRQVLLQTVTRSHTPENRMKRPSVFHCTTSAKSCWFPRVGTRLGIIIRTD